MPSTSRRPHRALGIVLAAALVAVTVAGTVAAGSREPATSAVVAAVEPDELHVISFNLRYATAPGPSWRSRRPSYAP